MEEFIYRGLTISIEQDTCAENPREFYDPLSTISYRSRSHILGDEEEPSIADAEEFVIQVLGAEVYDDIDYLEEEILDKYEELVSLALSKSKPSFPINDRRDQELARLIKKVEKQAKEFADANYVYKEVSHRESGWSVAHISLADASKEWGTNPADGWDATVQLYDGSTDTLRGVAESQLDGEIEAFVAWANGNVWFYTIEDDEGEDIDSCGGFYGEYGSDGWKYMIQCAKESADAYIEKVLKQHDLAKKAMQDAHIPLSILGDRPVFDQE